VRIIMALMVLLVAVVGSAGAATYYVDSDDGRDDPAWNGGPLEPWRTITYALSRTNGENTFMCRGAFEEEVIVEAYGIRPTFVANPQAVLKGYIKSPSYVCELTINGFRVYGYTGIGDNGELVVEDCYFNNPGGPAVTAYG
jgi:hypothetical protein